MGLLLPPRASARTPEWANVIRGGGKVPSHRPEALVIMTTPRAIVAKYLKLHGTHVQVGVARGMRCGFRMKNTLVGMFAVVLAATTLFAGTARAALTANGLTINGLTINGLSLN